MSYSSLVSYVQLSPNCTKPRRGKIDTITIHCTGGQCDIETLGGIFAPRSRGASANYGIDRHGRIGCFVEEEDRSWCSSSSANDHRAITIEVSSDANHPHAVTEAAYGSLIELLVDICRRNYIDELRWMGDKSLIGHPDKQNMTVHRWFASKACPGDWLYSRHGEIAETVNRKLKCEEDDDMDVEKFTELYHEMREKLKDNDSSEYSAEARQWSVDSGLITGNGTEVDGQPNYMWEDTLTREQLVTVLYRFAKLMGKV